MNAKRGDTRRHKRWSLILGPWSFPGVWNLGFGACPSLSILMIRFILSKLVWRQFDLVAHGLSIRAQHSILQNRPFEVLPDAYSRKLDAYGRLPDAYGRFGDAYSRLPDA
jgi:hypothetical protein